MFVRLKRFERATKKLCWVLGLKLFIIYLFIYLFFNKRVWGGVWGLVVKVGLNTAVLQLVLPGIFLEIWERLTTVSVKFLMEKPWGRSWWQLAMLQFMRIWAWFMWYFTHCILPPCSQYLLSHPRFLKIHHFIALGLVSQTLSECKTEVDHDRQIVR